MKKLIIASLLLLASQGIFAQLDWSLLNEEYVRMYTLAERVSEETNKVDIDDDSVSIKGDNLALTFQQKKLDNKIIKENYKYYLVKEDGSKLPLNKVYTEKLIKWYSETITKIDTDLKANRETEIENLLGNFFKSGF